MYPKTHRTTANSLVIGTAVINTHTYIHQVCRALGGGVVFRFSGSETPLERWSHPWRVREPPVAREATRALKGATRSMEGTQWGCSVCTQWGCRAPSGGVMFRAPSGVVVFRFVGRWEGV